MSDRSGPQSLASLWLLSELCWVLKIEFHVCSTVGVFAVISQASVRIKRNNIYNIVRMLRVLRFSKMVSWQVCWGLRYMSIANGISRKFTSGAHPPAPLGTVEHTTPNLRSSTLQIFPVWFRFQIPICPMPVFSFPTSLWVAKDTDYIPCTSGSSFGFLYD